MFGVYLATPLCEYCVLIVGGASRALGKEQSEISWTSWHVCWGECAIIRNS